jgi:hypothetical protein
MSLTCECDGDYDWWYFPPDDYIRLVAKRGRRCVSCKTWIRPGDLCIEFQCAGHTRNSIEERIHGGEVPLPPKYHCEACADQYFNLTELGFCVELEDNMQDLRREYVEVYALRRQPTMEKHHE